MCKKVSSILSGIPATAVSLVLLIISFVLGRLHIALPVDPAWGAVVISGLPLLYLTVERAIHNKGINKISSELLIIIAMTGAIVIQDLFAAGEVAVIMAIGAILEEMTTNRAKRGLLSLMSLAPTMGRRIRDGKEEMISAEEIRVGDILRILPGEAVPVDGTVVQGETSIDQSIMTGESLPVDKTVGDSVFCGTVNRFGAVDVVADSESSDSSLQKMVRMVQEADANKAQTARIVDRFAGWMVPASLAIAIIAFLVTRDIVRSVTVLLVFCPCALVLSTPTAIMAAIGQAAKHGILVKSGSALEIMGKVNTVTFDKTGTLTYGRLEVCDVRSFDEHISLKTLLNLCASAESKSEHPLGRAVVNCAQQHHLTLTESEDFHMTAGKGIYAKFHGREVLCGNERYLADHNVPLSLAAEQEMEELRTQGKAMILVSLDGRCVGLVALSDVVRPTAKTMIANLAQMGTTATLLTGDHEATATYFASRVGITEVHAQLLPEEKATRIAQIQREGRSVCMIGDGVNDALALKTADVGVAMGGMGSDIAMESADIVLMSDDISRLPYLKQLSNATVRTIKQGIAASMTINMIALILSLLGLMGPTMGALVHNVGSVLVVMFAGLLYDRKFSMADLRCPDCEHEGKCETCTREQAA